MNEYVDAWIRLAWPDQLRSMRATVASQIAVAPEAPEPAEVERLARPLRWLLERCAAGVTLTQSRYLPPVLVAEAVDAFGWWPFGGRPRSEVDVHQLEDLRSTARRLQLITRRGRRLTTSRTGRAMLSDPARLWDAVARGVGSSDDYARMVGELVTLRLLAGAAEEADLDAAVIPIIRTQDWRSGRKAMDENQIRWSIHEPLRYWRLFGLLHEMPSRWDEHVLVTPWTVSFTAAGRLAGLTFLHARATEDLKG